MSTHFESVENRRTWVWVCAACADSNRVSQCVCVCAWEGGGAVGGQEKGQVDGMIGGRKEVGGHGDGGRSGTQ